MTAPKGAAQIAASIAYADAPRPDGLPDDMQPLPGAGLRFLSLTATDGCAVAAALWQPKGKPPEETTILMQVHGSGGNFAELPLRATARVLSARGYAALAISTRQHDFTAADGGSLSRAKPSFASSATTVWIVTSVRSES
jgi:hypothetical protein